MMPLIVPVVIVGMPALIVLNRTGFPGIVGVVAVKSIPGDMLAVLKVKVLMLALVLLAVASVP